MFLQVKTALRTRQGNRDELASKLEQLALALAREPD